MTVDEKIAELEGLLARARAVKAAYQDAHSGHLPNGDAAWVSTSARGSFIWPSSHNGLQVFCLYTKVGDVAVFEAVGVFAADARYAFASLVLDNFLADRNTSGLLDIVRRMA